MNKLYYNPPETHPICWKLFNKTSRKYLNQENEWNHSAFYEIASSFRLILQYE